MLRERRRHDAVMPAMAFAAAAAGFDFRSFADSAAHHMNAAAVTPSR